MRIFEKNEECCGCTACYSICPKDAIKMCPDREGFFYPQIDNDRCIECGLCKKVCSFQQENKQENSFEQRYFAMRSKNPEILYESSSGGVFSVLSDFILSQGGIICGVVLDSDLMVRTIATDQLKERDEMRGSKYVQSNLGDMYSMVEETLKAGRKVMFSGTPCQIAGVREYLNVRHINMKDLYLCDFVCHGVSSPLIWKEYINFLKKMFHSEIEEFRFRSKQYGWKNMKMRIVTRDGDKSEVCNKKFSYLKLYSSLMITRPSCFLCKYTSFSRKSDITVADFWNVGSACPEFNDNKGISTVLVNTEKGEQWIEAMKERLDFQEVAKADCWQPHLEYSAVQPANRERFWQEYNQRGISFVLNKYGRGTITNNIIRMLTPVIKKMGLYVVAGKVYKLIFGRKKSE